MKIKQIWAIDKWKIWNNEMRLIKLVHGKYGKYQVKENSTILCTLVSSH